MTGDLPDRRSYIDAVRQLYVELPNTPCRFSRADRHLAGQLFHRAVPLPVIRSAFLLATARRLVRLISRPPLSPIRSIHYFVPVLDEVSESPLPSAYLQYLESKIRSTTPTGAR